MCLRYQGVDNDKGGVDRVRQVRRLSDNDVCVGRGQGIYNASKGLETKRRRRLLDDGPKESMTTTEVSAEGDEHEDYNNNNGGIGRGYTTRPRY